MSTDYHRKFQKDYGELYKKVESLEIIIKTLNSTICSLNIIINIMNETATKRDDKIDRLILENERLKNNNDKDSSNSGKPSSKNGFKKVQNSRTKSNKKPGGQKGHKGKTTDVSKIKKLIEEGLVEHNIIEIGKNKKNKNKEYITRYIQDIKIISIVKEYRYYPDDNGKYNVPKSQNNVLTYGDELKAVSMLLVHRVPASMDQTVDFLKAITHNTIDVKKSTLVNWSKSLSNKLTPFCEEILQSLYNASYVHTDESPLNVNGSLYQLHNYSNDKYTMQYMHKNKSKKAMEELNFLNNYMGTLIHDHNIVQYN
jgi:hypothetical protein